MATSFKKILEPKEPIPLPLQGLLKSRRIECAVLETASGDVLQVRRPQLLQIVEMDAKRRNNS